MSHTTENRRGGKAAGPPCQMRREEILDAATELFAAHGYSDAVTQELVGRRALK